MVFHWFQGYFRQHVVIVLHCGFYSSFERNQTESYEMNLALKDRAEVELESTMGLCRGSALIFLEVNIGLSAVTLNTDLL